MAKMKRQSIDTVRNTSFFKTMPTKNVEKARELKVDNLYRDVCKLRTTMLGTVPSLKETALGEVKTEEAEDKGVGLIENGRGKIRVREAYGDYGEVKRLDIMQEEILGVSETIQTLKTDYMLTETMHQDVKSPCFKEDIMVSDQDGMNEEVISLASDKVF